jgi:N-acetylglucosaminyldiphosphoundecaprenol N-acetyl-beta-D-mannosaminyltransferase
VTTRTEFKRQVYGVLGMPVDVMSMDDLVARISESKRSRRKLFISTPNLNFLIMAQNDEDFRRSVIASDLCPVDGIGVVVVCRLLGIPVRHRVAGSDIPKSLAGASPAQTGGQIRFALFGGENGAANAAMAKINAEPSNIECVGAIDPGRVTPQTMVSAEHIEQLNRWNADFLLVALGAQKGQTWIMQNMPHLNTPVISHLGATINFLAGTVKRAPRVVQSIGGEWLWRIKEEPKLARRYVSDGLALARLTLFEVLPLAYWFRTRRKKIDATSLAVNKSVQHDQTVVHIGGAALNQELDGLRAELQSACSEPLAVTIDVKKLQFFEAGFCGELLLAEKACRKNSKDLTIINADADISWALRKAQLGYLLA